MWVSKSTFCVCWAVGDREDLYGSFLSPGLQSPSPFLSLSSSSSLARENWTRTDSWIIHLVAAFSPLLVWVMVFQSDPTVWVSLLLDSCLSGQNSIMCLRVWVLYPHVHSGVMSGTRCLVRYARRPMCSVLIRVAIVLCGLDHPLWSVLQMDDNRESFFLRLFPIIGSGD